MELTSSSHTSVAGNLALIGFTFGEALVTIFAYLARDWLLLKWIISGYFALVLPYLYFAPESPYWLFSTKKYNQLEHCLNKIAKKNGRSHDQWYPYYIQLIHDPDIAMRQAKHAARTTREKFLRHIFRLIICGLIGFVTVLLYYNISYGLSAMNNAVSPYWNTIIGAAVESIGYISASILITTRFGRKYSLMIYLLLTSICVFIIPFITKPLPVFTVVISQIGKLTISGAVWITWIYVPEMFSTSMRGLANGVFVFVGRGGAIIAPIIDAAVSDEKLTITFYIYASLTIILTGIIYFLPETRNRSFHTDEDEEKSENDDKVQADNSNENKNGIAMNHMRIPRVFRSNGVDI
ncbi:unnamed protein product [Rotaria sp. Silwood2]|nr:unnamed protein product [Rotaria sp. Silwood2]CAF3210390.1 unnamed protein product [Rotaria sp. Silwood2]CAF4363255.1 unnamed protein product [Rotaria sp. Silwood2]CAF4538713.1 unnamed protein product [Rotaria sp. Silwood2]